MIACASPADCNADESINTLRYAQRARSIQNLATQHSSQMGAGEATGEVLALRKELRLLQLQLAQTRGVGSAATVVGIGGGGGAGGDASLPLLQVLREENGRLRASLQQMEAEARAAAEAGALNALLLESLRLRLEQVGAVAKEAGLELPPGLLGDDGALAAAAAVLTPPSVLKVGTAAAPGSGESSSGAVAAASGVMGESSGSVMGPERLAASLKSEADEEADAEGEGEGGAEGLAAAQTLVSGELASLDEEIKRKEEAVAQLAREDQCFGQLKSFFEGTIARLQAEVQALQGERERLATALSKSQATGQGADPAVVAGMRAREKELERKLRELQAKSASYNRLMQLKGRAEDEARRLRGEIEAAKRRQGELMRRHREEAKRLCKERRAKELEAVRLRRNEAKMKCEYERTLQTSARQEAVLRRKLEEVSAVCKQYQETVRRLTEGSKGRFEGQNGGPRQQQRHRELRRHVQREMEDCRAYLAKRAILQQLMERRAGLATTDAEQRQQQQHDEGEEEEELSASIRVLQKELLEAEAAVLGGGLLVGRDVSGSPAAGGDEQAGAAAVEEALITGEVPSAVVGSTRRWVHIKTLGEARHVMAYLFEAALASSSADDEQQQQATAGPMAGASPAALPSISQAQPVRVALVKKSELPPSASSKQKEEVEGEEEEEEDDWEDSSSSEEEEESDEEYVPSPSRPRARARGNTKRGSKEGKQKQQKARARGSGSSGAGGLEDEIDALLSDGEEGRLQAGEGEKAEEQEEEGDVFGGGPRPTVASLEPLGKCTVAQLKRYLKAFGLPLSGRKGTCYLKRGTQQKGEERTQLDLTPPKTLIPLPHIHTHK
jgi:hypothetical protein